MPSKLDLTNQRYGRLVVIREDVPRVRNGRRIRQWFCVCDCGSTCVALIDSLRSGKRKSCGCLNIETGGSKPTHGHSLPHKRTKTYMCWSAMKSRCLNPRSHCYKDYGGRGITVCERWNSFEKFLEDMGEKPPGLTLERIDNSAGYGPENCRWATSKEQNRNSRRNALVSFNGQTHCIAKWVEVTGIGGPVIRTRIARGWTIERTLTTPTQFKKRSK